MEPMTEATPVPCNADVEELCCCPGAARGKTWYCTTMKYWGWWRDTSRQTYPNDYQRGLYP